MELLLLRGQRESRGIPGNLLIDGDPECLTLENDELCIQAGRYRLVEENSPHFGPGTLTIKNVPGRSLIRIHGGTTERDSKGCVLVGDRIDWMRMTIYGAKFDHVLDNLKAKVRAAIYNGDEVWITVQERINGN